MFLDEGINDAYNSILEERWDISRSDDYPITLVNPADTNDVYSLDPDEYEGLILKINDNDNGYIDYVLFKGKYHGWWIKHMFGDYLVNPDGNKVLVKGIIESNQNTLCYPPVGPVGKSGWSTGYHLHLSLCKDDDGYKRINPFYYVGHGPVSQPLIDAPVTVSDQGFLKKNGMPYTAPYHFSQLDWVVFKATVDSRPSLDLNSVNFYIVDKNNNEILLHKPNTNRTFSFGGREDYNWNDSCNTGQYVIDNISKTGVKQGDKLGIETFIYLQSMLNANNGNALAPGKYKFKVVAEDVNGNLSSNQPTIDFEVGKWQNIDLSVRPHKSSTDKYIIESDDACKNIIYKMSPSYYSSSEESPICFEIETKDSVQNISANVVGLLKKVIP